MDAAMLPAEIDGSSRQSPINCAPVELKTAKNYGHQMSVNGGFRPNRTFMTWLSSEDNCI
jgi:hypothetical protein